jgi:uncharacterized membrane protein HdeD (DUF308 family)
MSFILEFLSQVAAAILFDRMGQRVPPAVKSWWYGIVFSIIGVVMGLWSLVLFPNRLISDPTWQVVNLIGLEHLFFCAAFSSHSSGY